MIWTLQTDRRGRIKIDGVWTWGKTWEETEDWYGETWMAKGTEVRIGKVLQEGIMRDQLDRSKVFSKGGGGRGR